VGDLPWQTEGESFIFGEDNDKVDKIFASKNAIEIIFPERPMKQFERDEYNWVHSPSSCLVAAFGFNFNLMNYRLLGLEELGKNNSRLRFIANIYPHGDSEFRHRRIMAEKIRTIKENAELCYLSCTEFLQYVFSLADQLE
jgi:hypothetical protein